MDMGKFFASYENILSLEMPQKVKMDEGSFQVVLVFGGGDNANPL